jgi:hypothetical protein
MDAVLLAINTWKDLIVKVFGQYPLAGALITLVAVGVFFYLEKTLRPKQAPTNILLVLLGWAVAVPILGAILWFLGELWDLVKAIAPPIASVLSSLFSIYQKHPFLVLSLIVIAIPAYFAWKRWRPDVLPSRFLRFLVLAIGVTAVAHLLSPIIPESNASKPIAEAAVRSPVRADSATGASRDIKPAATPKPKVATPVPALPKSRPSPTSDSSSLPVHTAPRSSNKP